MVLNSAEQKQFDKIKRRLGRDSQFVAAMRDARLHHDRPSTYEPTESKKRLTPTKKTRPERLNPKRWHTALAAGVVAAFGVGVALNYADSLKSSYIETHDPTPIPSPGQSPDMLPSLQPQVETTVPPDFGNDFIEEQRVVPKVDPSATGHRILTGRESGVE